MGGNIEYDLKGDTRRIFPERSRGNKNPPGKQI